MARLLHGAFQQGADSLNAGRSCTVPAWKKEVVRALWRAARTDAEHAFALAPQDEQTERLLARIREQLDTLDTDPSQEG